MINQLAIKDRQLILAAKCGKVLLEQKEELERQIDIITRDYQQRIDVGCSNWMETWKCVVFIF